jgi:O-antigen/teichoic acid export membrane protein
MKIVKKLINLKNNQGIMKYFTNMSWLFVEKILRIAVGGAISIWVARYLGPEKFGLFNYALSFVGLFAVIATLGLDGIVIRELIKDEKRRDELVGTAFVLKLFGAIIVLTFLGFSTYFTINDVYTNTLIFIVASTTVFQSFNVVDFYFQSKVMSKYVVYSNVISLFISSFIKMALVIFEAPLISFAWVVLFDSFILAAGYLYFYIKSNSFYSVLYFNFNKETAIFLLKNSWPLMLSGVVISIYMKVDQVMIKEILNVEAVGQYAAAVRLSEAWYFVPGIISSSIFPAILNAKKTNIELYYSRLQSSYDFIVMISIFVGGVTYFSSDFIVNVLYGEEYFFTSSILVIHIWTGVFVGLGIFRGAWILAENLQRYTFIYLGGGGVINILCNYLFIPAYGAIGAAYATLLSQALSVFLFPCLFKKTRLSFFMMLSSLCVIPSVLRMIKRK